MDVTQSLLVAMMFVMVLSIGIGNILLALSTLVDLRSAARAEWLPTSWLLLLLLQHLYMFWHTLDIVEVEDWNFAGFLFVLLGPIVLLLATGMILPTGESESPGAHYERVAPRFFSTLALLMLWEIPVDPVLGKALGAVTASSVVLLALFACLAASRRRSVHLVVTGLVWLIFLSILAGRGSGVVA